MKFQQDKSSAQIIDSYGPDWIVVGGEQLRGNLVIGSHGERQAWSAGHFENLDRAAFDSLAALRPELVIFGSGERLRFPRPGWLVTLMAQRIGVETMDTAAACRTYNILASEGRHVVAALLLPQPQGASE